MGHVVNWSDHIGPTNLAGRLWDRSIADTTPKIPDNPAEARKDRDDKGRFAPGNRVNPNGRPKRKRLEELVLDRLDAVDPETGRAPIELIADKLVDKLGNLDPKIFEPLIRRLWPEVHAVDLSGGIELSGIRERVAQKLERLADSNTRPVNGSGVDQGLDG